MSVYVCLGIGTYCSLDCTEKTSSNNRALHVKAAVKLAQSCNSVRCSTFVCFTDLIAQTFISVVSMAKCSIKKKRKKEIIRAAS